MQRRVWPILQRVCNHLWKLLTCKPDGEDFVPIEIVMDFVETRGQADQNYNEECNLFPSEFVSRQLRAPPYLDLPQV